MFHVIYSTEHNAYASVPVGSKIPFGWQVEHTTATKEACQEWVWDTNEMWDSLNEKMDSKTVKA